MRRLLLSLVSLAVLCGLVETALRTAHAFNARLTWTEPDRQIGWRFTPGREYWFFAENDHPVTGRNEWINPLKQHSALVSLVAERYNMWRQTRTAAGRTADRIGLTNEMRLCTSAPDSVFSAQYGLCKELIARMARRCGQDGVRFAHWPRCPGLRARRRGRVACARRVVRDGFLRPGPRGARRLERIFLLSLDDGVCAAREGNGRAVAVVALELRRAPAGREIDGGGGPGTRRLTSPRRMCK
jgi:hypothetical protein